MPLGYSDPLKALHLLQYESPVSDNTLVTWTPSVLPPTLQPLSRDCSCSMRLFLLFSTLPGMHLASTSFPSAPPSPWNPLLQDTCFAQSFTPLSSQGGLLWTPHVKMQPLPSTLNPIVCFIFPCLTYCIFHVSFNFCQYHPLKYKFQDG